MSATPRTLDVSALPPGAFGSRTLTFWGTLGIVVIESTVFGAGHRLVLLSGQPIACLAAARCRAARSPLGNDQHARAARQPRSQ